MSPAIGIAFAGGAIMIAWIIARPIIAARRRKALRCLSLDDEQRELLRRNWPGYRRLPAAAAVRLDELTAVFLGEKEFVGCRGLVVTPLMRLVIAAQACLLVLAHGRLFYDRLRSVLVYPSQFVVPEQWQDEDGVVTDEERVLVGQAWDVSRILLSWEDVQESGREGEAYNVVIHEFAHYLDHETGGADGASWLGGFAERRRWSEVLQEEFESLRATVNGDAETFLDPYGAEDIAEFFAVASEAFFEEPRDLARERPALYRVLCDYYRVDPATW
jgi:hypothetical protein